jgi:hypothetical protein
MKEAGAKKVTANLRLSAENHLGASGRPTLSGSQVCESGLG